MQILPPEQSAARAGLVYVTDAQPGISRRRQGRGWSYRWPDGSLVDGPHRDRAEALVIPPAYRDVWICTLDNGHLQATGRDAKGRKQYRYHPDWIAARQETKFNRLIPFGEALPGLRARVDDDLGRAGLPRDKVLALAVRLLDETLIRIGNPDYAQANGSYGLTTLRDRHASFDGTGVRFEFVGKSGKRHAVALEDRRLARLVKACRDVPGYDLFQYIEPDGDHHAIDSGMVNAYLKETTGEPITAKYFRTWGGTVLAAKALRARGPADDEADAKQHKVDTVREVAAALGNTKAVCRKYYVHPGLFTAYDSGALLDHLKRRHPGNTPRGLEPTEAAVLRLLKERAA
ncbi:MAG: DNA topoisomerase IB [Bacteroidota bacterium]